MKTVATTVLGLMLAGVLLVLVWGGLALGLIRKVERQPRS